MPHSFTLRHTASITAHIFNSRNFTLQNIYLDIMAQNLTHCKQSGVLLICNIYWVALVCSNWTGWGRSLGSATLSYFTSLEYSTNCVQSSTLMCASCTMCIVHIVHVVHKLEQLQVYSTLCIVHIVHNCSHCAQIGAVADMWYIVHCSHCTLHKLKQLQVYGT